MRLIRGTQTLFLSVHVEGEQASIRAVELIPTHTELMYLGEMGLRREAHRLVGALRATGSASAEQ